jgi:hypothetical protein
MAARDILAALWQLLRARAQHSFDFGQCRLCALKRRKTACAKLPRVALDGIAHDL